MESPRLANYLLVLVTGILALVTYFLYGATRNLVAVERKPEQEHSKQAVLTALGHLEQAMDFSPWDAKLHQVHRKKSAHRASNRLAAIGGVAARQRR